MANGMRFAAVFRILIATALLVSSFLISSRAEQIGDESRFITQARDLSIIDKALAAGRPGETPPGTVTGVTVPHHLLAADLIARGIWAASSGKYKRIIIVSPDHFKSLKTAFGVTTKDLPTAKGALNADTEFARALLKEHGDLLSDTGDIPKEHGVHSVAPFVKAIFPDVPVLAITVSSSSTVADWRKIADIIGARIGRETLIVQSTDYSHHLPVAMAALKDQETMAVTETRSAETAATRLREPDNLDSAGSQHIQMRLLHR